MVSGISCLIEEKYAKASRDSEIIAGWERTARKIRDLFRVSTVVYLPTISISVATLNIVFLGFVM